MKRKLLLVLTLVSVMTQAQIPPVTVLDTPILAQDIAFYNGFMYFSDPDTGTIGRADLSNPTAPPQDILTGLQFPSALSFIGSELYFLESGDETMITTPTGELSKIDVSQMNPSATSVASTLLVPLHLETVGNNGYFSEYTFDMTGDIASVSINHINLTTAVRTTLYTTTTNGITDMQVIGNDLYLSGFDLINDTDAPLLKIDITNNTATTAVNFFSTPDGSTIGNLDALGNEIYFTSEISDMNGITTSFLKKFDVTAATPSIAIVADDFTDPNSEVFLEELQILSTGIIYQGANIY